ncbi:DUF3021 family protein [Anaerovibrio sp. RM50]|nr:DUF3021 family protein [Anaerovibrio sp. RM50]
MKKWEWALQRHQEEDWALLKRLFTHWIVTPAIFLLVMILCGWLDRPM